MKKLNEQWIEVIDGQEHMMKAVKSFDGKSCNTCIYFGDMRCEYKQKHNVSSCPTGGSRIEPNDIIVKDLGILRLRDGVLPCPFCGEYPSIKTVEGEYSVRHVCPNWTLVGTKYYDTKQKAIDAWNRRL